MVQNYCIISKRVIGDWLFSLDNPIAKQSGLLVEQNIIAALRLETVPWDLGWPASPSLSDGRNMHRWQKNVRVGKQKLRCGRADKYMLSEIRLLKQHGVHN